MEIGLVPTARQNDCDLAEIKYRFNPIAFSGRELSVRFTI